MTPSELFSEHNTCPTGNKTCVSVRKKILGVSSTIGLAGIGGLLAHRAIVDRKGVGKALTLGAGAASLAASVYTARSTMRGE